MRSAQREPFGNMRFRVEIEGLQETGASEVIFPEARLAAGPRKSRVVQIRDTHSEARGDAFAGMVRMVGSRPNSENSAQASHRRSVDR